MGPCRSRLRKEFIDAIDLGALQLVVDTRCWGPSNTFTPQQGGKVEHGRECSWLPIPHLGHSLSAWAYASL